MKIGIAMAFNESTDPAFIKDAVQMAEAGSARYLGARACAVLPGLRLDLSLFK